MFFGRKEHSAGPYDAKSSAFGKSPPLLVINEEESRTSLDCQDNGLCFSRIDEEQEALKVLGWFGLHTDEPLQADGFLQSSGAGATLSNPELVEDTRRNQDLLIEILEKAQQSYPGKPDERTCICNDRSCHRAISSSSANSSGE